MVNVSAMLLTVSSPDESSVKYEVEFLLYQEWFDHRLQFDDNKTHPYLNGLTHRELIWKPDTYFIKHGEVKQPIDPVHMALKIYPNGTVLYIFRYQFVYSLSTTLIIVRCSNHN